MLKAKEQSIVENKPQIKMAKEPTDEEKRKLATEVGYFGKMENFDVTKAKHKQMKVATGKPKPQVELSLLFLSLVRKEIFFFFSSYLFSFLFFFLRSRVVLSEAKNPLQVLKLLLNLRLKSRLKPLLQ